MKFSSAQGNIQMLDRPVQVKQEVIGHTVFPFGGFSILHDEATIPSNANNVYLGKVAKDPTFYAFEPGRFSTGRTAIDYF